MTNIFENYEWKDTLSPNVMKTLPLKLDVDYSKVILNYEEVKHALLLLIERHEFYV